MLDDELRKEMEMEIKIGGEARTGIEIRMGWDAMGIFSTIAGKFP